MDKIKIFRFEKSNSKGDLFQNVNPEKEAERTLETFDAFHNVFKQFLKDPKKFLYQMTKNYVVSFMHVPKNENESQTIALLSGKNKNLCKLLEKESLQLRFLNIC